MNNLYSILFFKKAKLRFFILPLSFLLVFFTTVNGQVANRDNLSGAYIQETPGNASYYIYVLDNDDFGNGVGVLNNPSDVIKTIIAPPKHGTAIIDNIGANGNPARPRIEYTPVAYYNGNDTLVYQICNAAGTICDTALVVITLIPVNNFPIAVQDIAYTATGTPVIVPVAQNDIIGGDGAPASSAITISVAPNHGTATVNNKGTPGQLDDEILYTPAPGFKGTDTLLYRIYDADGSYGEAELIIYVSVPTTNPDYGQNDGAFTGEDTPVSIFVLGNDNFGGDGPSTGPTFFTIIDSARHGFAIVDSNATPDRNNLFDYWINYTPAPNYVGLDTLTYQICDSNGDCSTALVIIVVECRNDYPAPEPDVATTEEDTPVIIDVTANDDFGGDGVGNFGAITIVDSTINGTDTTANGPFHGTATVVDINNTPNDPSDDVIEYTPNPGFVGTDTLVYKICDSTACSGGGGNNRPAGRAFSEAIGDCITTTVIITIGGPLPVTLTSFTAQPKPNCTGVVLKWATASEQNNKQFVIERKSNGSAWSVIGTVAAAGVNSTSNINYTYIDATVSKATTAQYRLRQQDLDGKEKIISSVVTVKLDCSKIGFNVFPNPFADKFTIETGGRKTGQVRVYNSVGQMVKSFNLTGNTAETISTAGWSKGLYEVIVTDNGTNVFTQKIVKL